MRIGKYNASTIENGFRIIKSFFRTRRDTQTNHQAAPWGDDSQPVGEVDVVQAETGTDEVTVIVGIIQQNKKAGPGEKRIFATDGNGKPLLDIWIKNDNTMEVGGSGDFMVRYNELETAFNQLKQDHDELVGRVNDITTLMKTWTTVPNDGGAALKAAALTQFTQDIEDSTADITPSKIENIKTSAHG